MHTCLILGLSWFFFVDLPVHVPGHVCTVPVDEAIHASSLSLFTDRALRSFVSHIRLGSTKTLVQISAKPNVIPALACSYVR